MSALGALLRPGALQNRDENGVSTTEHYCLRKNKEEFASSIHDVVDRVLEPTEKLLVYQEQSMLLGKYIAGFDLKNVDRLRKCISKKDMKEMHEVKKLFLEGAKETNSVPYEMAEMLWSWIEKSGRYAFNKSHSVSYGAIGYDTAYLKIHFPLQFFTEWLRLSADKIEPDIEKMELIEEAKKFDIKVNPPKIEYKQYLFEHNGKEIFFGLTDIKGVGESNLEKLFKSVDEAEIDVKTAKWVDWLYRIVPKNYAVVQKMIMAGCFDSFKIKRQRMLAEIAVVNELTDKEIKWMIANSLDVSFIDGLRLLSQEKPKGGCANVKRRAAVQSHADMLQNPPSPQNDSIPWLVWAEVQTLGLAVTVSKVEAFTLEDVNTTCKDFQTGKTGMLIFGVEVKDFREVKTKKGKQAGKEMAFMSISDPSGTIDNVICFPETWQNYKHLVIKGNTILLKGERDRENNGLIVQTISQLV
jgi:DNA polymerase-3 subunit alpha